MDGKARDVRPYSRTHTLAKLDRRTRESALLSRTRSELTAHVGGKPSATQAALIERAAWLTLHVALLDAKIVDASGPTDHDSRTYLAWSNSLTRTLAALGLQAVTAKPKTMSELLQAGATA